MLKIAQCPIEIWCVTDAFVKFLNCHLHFTYNILRIMWSSEPYFPINLPSIFFSIYLFIILNSIQGISFIVHQTIPYQLKHKPNFKLTLILNSHNLLKTRHYVCVVIYCWGGKLSQIKATVKMIIF